MSVKPLDKKELEKYKKILQNEKEKTLKLITKISVKMKKGSKNSSGDLSSFAIHQADLGTDTSNLEKEVYLLEQEQIKLQKINRALKWIYDKTYGICQITGKYISKMRLKAVPWARYSIAAKEAEEKKKRRR
ncbi:MAG: TraR/DksA C4-type zinc finger protein [Candidatus Cloacimonetes bacterium]|nr:TraR/DksA C4-type zinc finger protein [Candidatus Cloacimonadota bacterium]